MFAPAVIEAGKLHMLGGPRTSGIDGRRDFQMVSFCRDFIVLAMEHKHGRGGSRPGSQNVNFCELSKKAFAASRKRRRRTRKRSEHDDAGDAVLASDDRSERTAERDSQQKHALRVYSGVRFESQQGSLVSRQFLAVTNRVARWPFT